MLHPWIVQVDLASTPVEHKRLRELQEILESEGFAWFGVTAKSDFPSREAIGGRNFFFAGSIEKALEASNHTNDLLLDPVQLRCQNYYPDFGHRLLQQTYGFYPFGELGRLKDFLWAAYGEKGDTPLLGPLLFIRPDDNLKTFSGEVVGEKIFLSWLRSLSDVPPQTLCVVSPFRPITREWRMIVVEGAAVAGTLYRTGERLTTEEAIPATQNVYAYTQWVAALWRKQPRAWVIDIAEVDNVLYVCEIGSIHTAGWYGCDVRAIVQALKPLLTS